MYKVNLGHFLASNVKQLQEHQFENKKLTIRLIKKANELHIAGLDTIDKSKVFQVKRTWGSESARKPSQTRFHRREGVPVWRLGRGTSSLNTPPPPPPPPDPAPGRGQASPAEAAGRRVGHKEEMGQSVDCEAAAAEAGPPSRGSEKEGGPSPPQLPLPREAAPTFLQAQDAAWAARDSETLSALLSPRARSSALRRPVTAPTSPGQPPEPIRPRGRPVFTSGRGRGACSGGGGGPTAGP
ncbi:atherin-like [Panthera uncia]|uniref:atherin-like n=1 Tax=Panthera uncia TaxID=29064 RepID=UPI0020FFA880|nr:atherin-like [Panthera uncia]